MAATLTAYNEPYGKDITAVRQILHGLLAFTAQTYTPGGILPSYTTIKDQSGQAVLLGTLNTAPDTMWLQTISGSGFVYGYNKSTGKVQIFGSGSGTANSAAVVELTAVALPAGVTGDTIEFEAEWVRQ